MILKWRINNLMQKITSVDKDNLEAIFGKRPFDSKNEEQSTTAKEEEE